MKMIYVGPIACDGTSLQRLNAFKALNVDALGVSTLLPCADSKHRIVRFIARILSKRIFQVLVNSKIRNLIKAEDVDVLWIDKGLLVFPSTLNFARRCNGALTIVSYSPDDMMNPNNQTAEYLDSIPLYDYHVTTKSYNVDELTEIGAPEVIFIGNAYDPAVHRPVEVSKDDAGIIFADVGCIGAYEAERVAMMEHLAENGIDVVFHCPAWPFNIRKPAHLRVVEGYLSGDAYAKQICAFEINLAFLRKVNRDLQTTRSIEIPACGAFMLAERTDEHEALFEAGEEAAFFETSEELLQQVRTYLGDDAGRNEIARKGLLRVKQSGYSNEARLQQLLKQMNLR